MGLNPMNPAVLYLIADSDSDAIDPGAEAIALLTLSLSRCL